MISLHFPHACREDQFSTSGVQSLISMECLQLAAPSMTTSSCRSETWSEWMPLCHMQCYRCLNDILYACECFRLPLWVRTRNNACMSQLYLIEEYQSSPS